MRNAFRKPLGETQVFLHASLLPSVERSSLGRILHHSFEGQDQRNGALKGNSLRRTVSRVHFARVRVSSTLNDVAWSLVT